MKDSKERLSRLCVESMTEKGLLDGKYRNRITDEFRAIGLQGKHDYFLELYDKKVKYPYNEKNLFVAYLLGLVPDFDIDSPPAVKMGEFPDIDVDFLPVVRDYLRKEYIPKEFGESNVCSISNYTTFGIKSALVDMARIHGYDRGEILSITTKIGLKDDDGKTITWEKAVEMHKELQEYLADKPEVADAARCLLHRNRGRGKHPGGLIISSQPIDDVVPLVLDTEGNLCSAWTEGLAAQDLQPMGYIKFDLLVLTDLLRIVECCKLIKKRYPELEKSGICAHPGMPDWSDISYLNDPKALALANKGKLKGVFQFDSNGIRRLCEQGGVTDFEDIPAYSSLYRPGCLSTGMDQKYVKRKRGDDERWRDDIHPKLKPILEKTYGVMLYQESTMQMLGVVGNISPAHQEIVRKAISKKKESVFKKYKEMFVNEGQKNLSWPKEAVENIWMQLESWCEYGFNKSVLKDTLVKTPDGNKEIQHFKSGDIVYCVDENGGTIETEVVNLHDHGELEGFEVTFDDGYKVTCSANHKFLTEKGQVSLREICETSSYVFCTQNTWSDYAESKERRMEGSLREHATEIEYGVLSLLDGCDEIEDMGLGAGHAPIADTRNLVLRKIIRICPVGRCHMYDLEVSNPTHNYILPNGIVTSNSHAVAYSYISARLLYLKANFPLEFYTVTLALEEHADKIVEYRREAENDGFTVNKLDLNKSGVGFRIVDDEIYIGFSNIKGIGHDVAGEIVKHQPYEGLEDFLDKFGTNANVLKPLISLCLFGDPADRGLHMEFVEHYKKEINKRVQRDKRHEISKEKYIDEMRFVVSDMLGEDREKIYNEDPHGWFNYWIECGCFDTVTLKAVCPEWCPKEKSDARGFVKMVKKYRRSVENNLKKRHADKPIRLDEFEPTGEYDPKMQELYGRGIEVAESMYYGFEWRSVVCRSPDYDPSKTFSQFDDDANFGLTCTVQVVLKGMPISTKTKKNKKPYWILPSKDANGRQERIVVWKEDYKRFQEWLEEYDENEERGGMFSMKVSPWYGSMFTLWSPPRHMRAQELGETKEDDPRIIRLAEPEEEKRVIDSAAVVERLGEGL